MESENKSTMSTVTDKVKDMASAASDAMSNVAEAAKDKLSGLKGEYFCLLYFPWIWVFDSSSAATFVIFRSA